MDPVNPAPAGNPQLTTHLLVSHKKNKNFHRYKVQLMKVNLQKTVRQLDAGRLLCHLEQCDFSQKPTLCYEVSGHRLKLSRFDAQTPDRIRMVQMLLHKKSVCYHLKFTFDGLQKICVGPKQFTTLSNLKFQLTVFDVMEQELLKLGESSLANHENLGNLMHGWTSLLERELKQIKSMEVSSTIKGSSLRINEEEACFVPDVADQPLIHPNLHQDQALSQVNTLLKKFGSNSHVTLNSCLSQLLLNQTESSFVESQFWTVVRAQIYQSTSQLKSSFSNTTQEEEPVRTHRNSVIRYLHDKLVNQVQPLIKLLVEPVLASDHTLVDADILTCLLDAYNKLTQSSYWESDLEHISSVLETDWIRGLGIVFGSNNSVYHTLVRRLLNSASPQEDVWLSTKYRVSSGLYSHMVGCFLKSCSPSASSSESVTEKRLVFVSAKYSGWLDHCDLVINRTHSDTSARNLEQSSRSIIKFGDPDRPLLE